MTRRRRNVTMTEEDWARFAAFAEGDEPHGATLSRILDEAEDWRRGAPKEAAQIRMDWKALTTSYLMDYLVTEQAGDVLAERLAARADAEADRLLSAAYGADWRDRVSALEEPET